MNYCTQIVIYTALMNTSHIFTSSSFLFGYELFRCLPHSIHLVSGQYCFQSFFLSSLVQSVLLLLYDFPPSLSVQFCYYLSKCQVVAQLWSSVWREKKKYDYYLYFMIAPYVSTYVAQKAGILFSFLFLPFLQCKLLLNLFLWCNSQ